MNESLPKLGDLEGEVMQLVWANGPVTAEAVREQLSRPLKESTVRTVLRRLEGGSDSIVASHSLIPEAMRHALSTLGVLLSPTLPLSRRQHEMIATVVSARNRCFY